MPRYYFDFRSGDVLSLDEGGLDLTDLEAAHTDVVSALAFAMHGAGSIGARGHRFVVEVCDELGKVLEVTAVFESTIFQTQ
jgi:hypothetical protein